jgi:hypothetical protein
METPYKGYGVSPMDISPGGGGDNNNNDDEGDNLSDLGFSPIAPLEGGRASSLSSRDRSFLSPNPTSPPRINPFGSNEVPMKPSPGFEGMRFSLVPERARRGLAFEQARNPGSRQQQERPRGEEQRFTVTPVRGGLEEALVNLAVQGKSFVILRMPDNPDLEGGSALIRYRPYTYGSYKGPSEVQFNVERTKRLQFRGYRLSTGNNQGRSPVPGIDDEPLALFPLNYDKQGWPQSSIVFSLVQVPGPDGVDVWTLSVSGENERTPLIVVLVAPRMLVRIFTLNLDDASGGR